VYGTPLGVGGLGIQAGNALRGLALTGATVHAIGPGPGTDAAAQALSSVQWHLVPAARSGWLQRTPLRREAGLMQWWKDRSLGRFAQRVAEHVRPDLCYTFTQVGCETLEWAKSAAIASVVESPNGHIRGFREVYVSESRTHCNARYAGHPTEAMTSRVERELELADRIRVSAEWSRRSMISAGISEHRVSSLQQPVDLNHFQPRPWRTTGGPLAICMVGSLDLRKGFVYLLRAARALGADLPVTLQLVGATGDRCSRLLLDRERRGLDVTVQPGDPREALGASELFVLPTLEDGSPFAVAEAMASGRPVITTHSTGAAEWVRPGESGWVVDARSADQLADAIRDAARLRTRLPEMGRVARLDTEHRAGIDCDKALAEWTARV
jgi:glycosyltransferase involved in cell wall biosynthesis